MKKFIFVFLISLSTVGFADGMGEPVAPWPAHDGNNPTLGQYRPPYGSQTGWTGGASYTPPGGMPLKENSENPRMRLANRQLMFDDGAQTVGASVPPLAESDYAYGRVRYVKNNEMNERLGLSVETESYIPDMSREWVAKEGQTLKSVLKEWALQEGWEIVWNTHREYPLKASAMFEGRFTDVSSALIRTFGRAAPPPYARFFYGNRVLLIHTRGDENED